MARIRGAIDRQVKDWESQPFDHFYGDDWNQLSEEEEYVFGLDRDRLPRMIAVMCLYESVCTIVAAEDVGFTEDEVNSAKAYLKIKGNETLEEFLTLATAVGGLTRREAFAYYHKHEFWHFRAGLLKYPHESECPPTVRFEALNND